MTEWWTYRPSDFLLFSARTYHRLFELYNADVWPLQALAAIGGVALLALLAVPPLRRRAWSARAGCALLAACWLWTGVVFHIGRYAGINWAATGFGAAFVAEGALLVGVAAFDRALRLPPALGPAGWLGAALVAWGVLVHPWLGVLAGRPWTQAEAFGLTPDPTALATVGWLALLRHARVGGRRPSPGALAWSWPIPLAWCAIAATTLWTLAAASAIIDFRLQIRETAMTARTTPPFRADHVGSFLRPKYLLEAREQRAKGSLSDAQLRAVEDRAIAEIVDFQQDVGLQSITDGEFRRTYFHIDFLEQLGGVKTELPVTVMRPDGTEELAPPVIRVVDKVRHVKDIQRADFEYLKSRVAPGRTPKVTIPSPTMLHFRGGRAGISKDAYPELDPDFYDDVAKAYGEELKSLADAGCTYVQMDDTNMAYLCDEKMREAARQRGDDPNELPHRYARFINKVVAHKPAGMTLAMHLCRGNFKSTHAAAGNYEPVAEALLSEMHLDAYFMEYDDDRSGDFRPLRYLPKGKIVVLGLVTTKFGQLESKDALKRRIDEAARYAPLEQLCLSPQCGFSSTVHGNKIAVDAQREKLRLVVETAREVWEVDAV